MRKIILSEIKLPEKNDERVIFLLLIKAMKSRYGCLTQAYHLKPSQISHPGYITIDYIPPGELTKALPQGNMNDILVRLERGGYIKTRRLKVGVQINILNWKDYLNV